MTACADSSVVVRLVTTKPDSPDAIAVYRRLGKPPLFFLLHVSCALELESELFLTTDERQAQLARAEGLKVSLPG